MRHSPSLDQMEKLWERMEPLSRSRSSNELEKLLKSLPAHLLEELDRLLTTATEPWLPNPGPQTEAYYSPAQVLLYGGAAGGGKTDLLFGLSYNEHYSSIIYRRQFTETQPLLRRAEELFLGRWGTWDKKGVSMRFNRPIGGFLEIGAVKDLGSEIKYQGHAHDLKAFDEGTAFAYQQFLYLCGWLRSTRAVKRKRIVVCTNPPTNEEGMWVIRHWAPWLDDNYKGKRAQPGELRYFIVDKEGNRIEVDTPDAVEYKGRLILPESHTFIPSSVQDNPFLANTDYESRLAQLPEPFRSKFLFGDFKSGITSDPYQLLPRAWVEAAFQRWRDRGGKPPVNAPRDQLGVDVSRGGRDRAVIAARTGNMLEKLIEHQGRVTASGVSFAQLIANEMTHKNTTAALDIVGVGSSPYDQLCLHKGGSMVWAMNGAESAEGQRDSTGSFGFVNARAWWHWKFREALDPVTGDDLALCPDDELLEELCSINFHMQSNGIKIESKDDIKKKLNGRSPDKADATIYAFSHPPAGGLGVFGLYKERAEAQRIVNAAQSQASGKDQTIRIVNYSKEP